MPEDFNPTKAERQAADAAHQTLTPDGVRAARSKLLWTLGSVGAMQHFGIRHPQYKLAKQVALVVYPTQTAEAIREVDLNRLRERVVRAEVEYMGIHRRLVEGGRSAHVAEGYHGQGASGVLTRARVHQVGRQFQDYVARAFPGEPVAALREVERLAADHGETRRSRARRRR